MSITYICFYCSPADATREQGQKTEEPDGTIKVLRTFDPKEKLSVKQVLTLDNGDIVWYLYRKPTRPNHPNKEEQRRRATRGSDDRKG